MEYDVFISYSSKDKAAADAVCAALEADGVRCWVAPRDIKPGENWATSILHGIGSCRVMVLVFSAHANESPHIRREVERAVNRGAPIAPLRIQDVMPKDDLEYFLSSSHWMDALTSPMEQHLPEFSRQVRDLLKATPAPPRPAPDPPAARRARPAPAPPEQRNVTRMRETAQQSQPVIEQPVEPAAKSNHWRNRIAALIVAVLLACVASLGRAFLDEFAHRFITPARTDPPAPGLAATTLPAVNSEPPRPPAVPSKPPRAAADQPESFVARSTAPVTPVTVAPTAVIPPRPPRTPAMVNPPSPAPKPTVVVRPPPAVVLPHAPKSFSNHLEMKFVRIEPGTFTMGSPLNEPGRFDNEAPHQVKLTRPFYLCTCHVRVAQFAEFVKETNYKTEAEKEGKGRTVTPDGGFGAVDGANWRKPGFAQANDHPVVLVSWNDAIAFCQWLSKKDSRHYRLPTEAEWEYACRAGTATAYFWGNDPSGGKGHANVGDHALKESHPGWNLETVTFSDGFVYTSPVARFKPNPYGLHDMLGNAFQWCDDTYVKHPDDLQIDPHETKHPTGPRIARGGSWDSSAARFRSAFRARFAADGRQSTIGFRVAADAP